MRNLDTFTEHYLICALWSSTDDDSLPLDDNYGIEDMSEQTINQAIEDCKDFRVLAAKELAESKQSDEQNSHDFWLTRNGHGTGFWDRGLGEVGRKLTDLAKTYGSCDLYVTDGEIYCS